MSWSTTPPGESQFEALKSFFREEFRKWRVKCAAATTAQYDDLKYPPSPQFRHLDRREAVERAERSADALEQEASKHLEVAFRSWEELSNERQSELWTLELARGIANKQIEIDKLKEAQSGLRQEASSLKIQIEQLNRLQQPREFKLVPPTHIPMDEKILFELQDAAVSQRSRGVGLNINDRHSDLSTIVATAIGRWKKVVVSTRTSGPGMGAQRSLGTPTTTISVASSALGNANQVVLAPPATAPSTPSLCSPVQTRTNIHTLSQPSARNPEPSTKQSAAGAPSSALGRRVTKPHTRARPEVLSPNRPGAGNCGVDDRRQNATCGQDEVDEDDGEEEDEVEDDGHEGEEGTSDNRRTPKSTKLAVQVSTTQAPVDALTDKNSEVEERDDENEGASDKDADAEMEDGDEFAHMHTPISRGVSANGEASATQAPTTVSQFKISTARTAAQRIPRTTGVSGAGLINASRSMPNINVPIHGHHKDQNTAADMLSMNTLGGDAMYMD
ncbi:hypothetical protein HMPREF1624_06729 [Sporothrix schenckii ATCC 58251]|uniref:Uncharacterized protein n=2 Tax=Sporothrix schenckii TaxID=29908 RepID=U7PPW8_SPOS1|nr:hypothetical protein HMPREF1624_06729 [Sporothrix schenckii ATCC 58251]